MAIPMGWVKRSVKPSPGDIHRHAQEGRFCADRDVFYRQADAEHIGGDARAST
jgi:hypothetical protein